MTTACLVFLSISLLLYLAATLLYQGHFLLGRVGWDRLGRNTLLTGAGINGLGLGIHFVISGMSPFSNMLFVIAILVLAVVIAGLVVEHVTRVRQLNLLIAPLAFLGLLHPVLMPVRFDDAENILLRFPWLGVHVAITLLGHVGFALGFCAAVIHVIQARLLRRGQLNRYLPALDTASAATFYATGAGFLFFTIGLGMGIVWLFGAPGEYLGPRDTKIWLSLPTWGAYALFLYLRGVRGQYGSWLMWLVITGFVLAAVNLVGVRHGFEEAIDVTASSTAPPAWPLSGPVFASLEPAPSFPPPGSASPPGVSELHPPAS